MRIATYEEAVALGIGDTWRREMSSVPAPSPSSPLSLFPSPRSHEPGKRPKAKIINEKGQNKTEAAFDVHLAEQMRVGRIADYHFELLKWKLADKTWLKLDYAIWLPSRQLIGVDVKGGRFIEDDAAVKLKVLARDCPHMPLYVAMRVRMRWELRRCGPGGIVPCDGSFLGIAA